MDENIIFKDEHNEMIFYEIYPYNYNVIVRTYNFSGEYNFFIQEDNLQRYLLSIKSMIDTLNGMVLIRDEDTDSFLKIYFDNNRKFNKKLIVSGQIGGSHLDNVLKFKFFADQTLLYALKRNLILSDLN